VDRAITKARGRAVKRELSLVDWTSALLMEDHGIPFILTTDRAFAQLGFRILPWIQSQNCRVRA
jgi:predicted nucleic acid-binding protein